jgi:GNAT superfamily N-acetyltransferase
VTERYVLEPLGKQHQREGFNCGNAVLNEFLCHYARQQSDAGANKTYVIRSAPLPEQVCGFYSLSAGAVGFSEAPDSLKKKLSRYPIPVARLGRLAVDQQWQGQGLGGLLLLDALRRTARIASELGIVAIIVDAKDERAVRFYEQYGFMRFSAASRQLYLTVKAIAKLFKE